MLGPARSAASTTKHHHPHEHLLVVKADVTHVPRSCCGVRRETTHTTLEFTDHLDTERTTARALRACTFPFLSGFLNSEMRWCSVIFDTLRMTALHSSFNWSSSGHFIAGSLTGRGHDNLLIFFFIVLRGHAKSVAIADGFMLVSSISSKRLIRDSSHATPPPVFKGNHSLRKLSTLAKQAHEWTISDVSWEFWNPHTNTHTFTLQVLDTVCKCAENENHASFSLSSQRWDSAREQWRTRIKTTVTNNISCVFVSS